MNISQLFASNQNERDNTSFSNQPNWQNLEGINQLPSELLQYIFSFLTLHSERTLLVNKEWKASTLEVARFQKNQEIKVVLNGFINHIASGRTEERMHLQRFLDRSLLPQPISFPQIQLEAEKIEDGMAVILKNVTKQEGEDLKQNLRSSLAMIKEPESVVIGERVLALSVINAKLEAIDRRLNGTCPQTLLDLANIAIDFAKIGRVAKALEMSDSISKKPSINPKEYASYALRVISNLLVGQKKLKQATAVALQMDCPWRQRLAFQAILKAYLSLNLVDRAIEVCNFMSGPLGKSAELLGIVNELVAKGRVEEAIKIAPNILNPIHKSFAYGSILRKLIEVGREEEAEKLAQHMPESDWQKSQAQAVIKGVINR
ncbi:F-box protein [Candidatus Protochlamydia phocaeensis]|uniref:F-box protein n=1 Tax=Candidatus Protochlamydia phocaeensis TaxID=1414722 RepID=UPI0008386868|nr:F-box protein [Candidatus Protochlamydia phocaeensis]